MCVARAPGLHRDSPGNPHHAKSKFMAIAGLSHHFGETIPEDQETTGRASQAMDRSCLFHSCQISRVSYAHRNKEAFAAAEADRRAGPPACESWKNEEWSRALVAKCSTACMAARSMGGSCFGSWEELGLVLQHTNTRRFIQVRGDGNRCMGLANGIRPAGEFPNGLHPLDVIRDRTDPKP